MGLFEDVKAIQSIESREIQQLKAENASLRKALISALRESEDTARKCGFEKLGHSHTKRELANAKAELKSYQCKVAALTRWKNFFRQELVAQEFLNAYQEQDIEKLKNKLVDSVQPGMLRLLNAVRNAPVADEKPLMLAAETE